ncbi:MAG: tetratricopeptide repeat protein [Bacteroidota bacterium]|nr:sel1 repeat family protein [Chlorobiota bacterium]MDW8075287.1 tetratricopeptide repeat protein [Bacteroidota bacterium]
MIACMVCCRQFNVLLFCVVVGVLSAQQVPLLPGMPYGGHGGVDSSTTSAIDSAVRCWWGIQRAVTIECACRWAETVAARDPIAGFLHAECIAQQQEQLSAARRADSIYAVVYSALRTRADKGDAVAMLVLAEYYRRGLAQVVPHDDSVAVLWSQAAQIGNPAALYLRARALLRQRGIDSTALFLLRQAVTAGSVPAMVLLAQHLLADSATVSAAVELLRRADSLGSADAALLLASCAERGLGIKRSSTDALRWVAIAADRGSALAMAELGVRLLQGVGMPADTAEALRWLLRSLSVAEPSSRAVIAGYLETALRDSCFAPYLDAVVRSLASTSEQRDDPAQRVLLCGSSVRVWYAWRCSEHSIPRFLALRCDGTAAVVSDTTLLGEWIKEGATISISTSSQQWAGRFVLLQKGLAAIEWGKKLALYSPLSSEQVQRHPVFMHHELIRPRIEILPPRIGDRLVRLRIRAQHVPQTGVVLMPLGIAHDHTARNAELAVSVRRLWRVWEDGVHEFVWEPSPEELPRILSGKYVLFLQCMWQVEGEDQTLVVKSGPFELPRRRH